MKIISVKQNTKEWREWRGKGLGASDAPSIMGDSPWTSTFELWLQKTGVMERPVPNEYQLSAMRRGTELEPKVRKMFEKKMGKEFPALSAEHSTHPFMRVSFDGYNEESNTILEIKCPNKIDHATAINGTVPKKYIAQVQQQLLISGAAMCYYVSWDGKSKNVAIVEVLPDLEYHKKLEAECIDFWTRVQNMILPEVKPKDIDKLVKALQSHLEKCNKIGAVLALLSKE